MTRMYYLLSGRRQLLDKIIMPPFIAELTEVVTKHLEAHGISIKPLGENISITLPEGTYQEELLPFVESSRYTVTLPDGYQFTHIQTRWGQSTIMFPLNDLPKEFWDSHQELYRYMRKQ
ncbi:hypothetical protein KDW_20510 [Dictyobacter vulcani]|uniref:Uncharacterized protein n=1 Tax=Dictyobacter vulcani TaxID=2607529 RepID=A0A5J4KP57_9CHLR|nr:hypothetical protein KDW_20510 [Dictyobacter vulcani]